MYEIVAAILAQVSTPEINLDPQGDGGSYVVVVQDASGLGQCPEYYTTRRFSFGDVYAARAFESTIEGLNPNCEAEVFEPEETYRIFLPD